MIWRPLVSEEVCEDCGQPHGESHAPGCQVGEDLREEEAELEAADFAIDEMEEDACLL